MSLRRATLVHAEDLPYGGDNGTVSFIFDPATVRDSQVARFMVTDYLELHREFDYSLTFHAVSTEEELAAALWRLTPQRESYEGPLHIELATPQPESDYKCRHCGLPGGH